MEAVRFEVDHRGEEGQFILTGFAVPANMDNVNHNKDSSDLECDAVIHLRNGSYGLIEIKLGGG